MPIPLSALRAAATRAGSTVGQAATHAARQIGGIPGSVGDFALNTATRGLNVAGGLASKAGLPTKNLGRNTVHAARRAVSGATGIASGSAANPLNIATGVGAMAAGGSAIKNRLAGGGQASPPPASLPTPGASSAQSFGQQLGGWSQRAQEMWKGLPVEARYAVGAGVPLALLGGLMGGRKGLGLGALGLGAAGLGAASGGMFGDGARRMVGKGLYNVGSFFGGGKGDTASQLDMLGKLSPELGATVLMGRDGTLSSQDAAKQYEFLTKNRDMISRMLPQLAGKSASSLAGTALLSGEDKAARCWSGFEPVPGSKPYTQGSCRPKGSKKTQKQMKEKKSALGLLQAFHKAAIEGEAAAAKQYDVTNKSHYSHPKKELEPVVNGKKPSTEGTHHHKVLRGAPEVEEHLRPEGALMHPDLTPQID